MSKLFDISFGNNFFDLTPKAKAIECKIKKWDYIKFKFLSAKETK